MLFAKYDFSRSCQPGDIGGEGYDQPFKSVGVSDVIQLWDITVSL